MRAVITEEWKHNRKPKKGAAEVEKGASGEEIHSRKHLSKKGTFECPLGTGSVGEAGKNYRCVELVIRAFVYWI